MIDVCATDSRTLQPYSECKKCGSPARLIKEKGLLSEVITYYWKCKKCGESEFYKRTVEI